MARHRSGNGLMLAGLILTLVGLAVAIIQTLDVPRYWTTLGVGVALLVSGFMRAVAGGRRQPDAGAS